MSYLVDTNVFSETARRKPDPNVVAWLREHEAELYVSSISIGEIRRYSLIVVTRNTADFKKSGVQTLNPFDPN